jgi:hypothetical protein
MRAQHKNTPIAVAIALLGTTAAQASILAPTAAGGSEAVLWVIRNSDSSAVAQDLGLQIGQVNLATLPVNLDPLVSGFITASGGLSGVTYSVTAAAVTGSTGTYLTTLLNSPPPTIKNGVINGTWKSAITNTSVGALNSGDATPTATNNAYGAFPATDLTNPTLSGFNLWGSSTDNTGPGDGDLYLNKYVTGTSPTGNAAVNAPFPDLRARLTADQLQFVPVPAAAWLFGSAIGLLGLARRKSA